jgi:hypothetical protein
MLRFNLFPKEEPGFVYFLRASTGDIKIGYTTDVPRRVSELQRASPLSLTLLNYRPGTRADEAHFHSVFSRQRLHGEWFSPSPTLLANAWRIGPGGHEQPFSLDQAAEILKRARRLLSREINAGTMKCSRDHQGEPRVSLEQIEDWIWHGLPVEQRV